MASRRELIHLGLFGAPVSHSQSPRIHGLFAEQAGLEIRYDLFETPAGTLAAALDAFALGGGSGCNITLPLKREALQLAGTVSDGARRAGAANTLILEPDGSWKAENTDGQGLIGDLSATGTHLEGARIAVIGAGGATAGILASLLHQRVQSVSLYNRTLDRATDLAGSHADLGKVTAYGLEDLKTAHAFDLVINATSLGHDDGIPPLLARHIRPQGLCYDLNYGTAAWPLKAWCAENGVDYRDGLGNAGWPGGSEFPAVDGIYARCRAGAERAAENRLSENQALSGRGSSSKSPSASRAG